MIESCSRRLSPSRKYGAYFQVTAAPLQVPKGYDDPGSSASRRKRALLKELLGYGMTKSAFIAFLFLNIHSTLNLRRLMCSDDMVLPLVRPGLMLLLPYVCCNLVALEIPKFPRLETLIYMLSMFYSSGYYALCASWTNDSATAPFLYSELSGHMKLSSFLSRSMT